MGGEDRCMRKCLVSGMHNDLTPLTSCPPLLSVFDRLDRLSLIL